MEEYLLQHTEMAPVIYLNFSVFQFKSFSESLQILSEASAESLVLAIFAHQLFALFWRTPVRVRAHYGTAPHNTRALGSHGTRHHCPTHTKAPPRYEPDNAAKQMCIECRLV